MTASKLPANPEERDAFLASILEELRQGKSFPQLAEQYGIPSSTLNNWMLTKVDNDTYTKVKEAAVIARITETIDRVENAATHLEVSRARESGRLWCFLGERLVRGLAAKQEISGPGGGPIQLDNLERARRFAFLQNVIDVDVVQGSTAST